mgnify:FL=1
MSIFPEWRRPTRTFLSDTDPYFSSVSLLLHMNGSNASTTFTDSSSNNLSCTVQGNAKLGTAQYKFGTASADFTSAGALQAPNNNTVLSLTNDFTLEFWVYQTGTGSSYDTVVSDASSTSLIIRGSGSSPGIFVTGSSSNIANTLTFANNTWHHIAVCRASGTYKAFKDGTDITTATITNTATLSLALFSIGKDTQYGRNFVGYVDEFRLTVGVARYAANFTPPTAPFPDF